MKPILKCFKMQIPFSSLLNCVLTFTGLDITICNKGDSWVQLAVDVNDTHMKNNWWKCFKHKLFHVKHKECTYCTYLELFWAIFDTRKYTFYGETSTSKPKCYIKQTSNKAYLLNLFTRSCCFCSLLWTGSGVSKELHLLSLLQQSSVCSCCRLLQYISRGICWQ